MNSFLSDILGLNSVSLSSYSLKLSPAKFEERFSSEWIENSSSLLSTVLIGVATLTLYCFALNQIFTYELSLSYLIALAVCSSLSIVCMGLLCAFKSKKTKNRLRTAMVLILSAFFYSQAFIYKETLNNDFFGKDFFASLSKICSSLETYDWQKQLDNIDFQTRLYAYYQLCIFLGILLLNLAYFLNHTFSLGCTAALLSCSFILTYFSDYANTSFTFDMAVKDTVIVLISSLSAIAGKYSQIYIAKLNFIKKIRLEKSKNYFSDWVENLKLPYLILKGDLVVFTNKYYEQTSFRLTRSSENLLKLLSKEKENTTLVKTLEDCAAANSKQFDCLGIFELEGMQVQFFFEVYAKAHFGGYTELFLIDISELIENERKILEEDYKNNFFAKIAHEFKTPICAVNSVISELELEENKFSEQLSLIKGLSDYTLLLVNDITSYCRSKAKIDIFESEVELNELVDFCYGVSVALLAASSNKMQNVSTFLRNNLESYNYVVRLDSVRLKQIIVNLLSNACKFTKNGSVSLNIREAFKGNEPFIQIEVADTGPGMEENKAKHLFWSEVNSFKRSESNPMGSGLGCSICGRIAKDAGFLLEVESELGKGTKISVFLPLSKAVSMECKTEKTVLLTGSNKGLYFIKETEASETKVMIVADDNLLIRKATASVALKASSQLDLNWEVIEAGDGIEVLNILQKTSQEGKTVGAVIIDEYMDFMNGSECIKIIKQFENEKKWPFIPCFSCSAFIDDSYISKIEDAGASGLLSKPVVYQELVKTLKELTT